MQSNSPSDSAYYGLVKAPLDMAKEWGCLPLLFIIWN